MLELTVVTLITAVISAVAMPKWSEFRRESHLASASFAVSADIQALRQHARRTSQTIDVTINSGTSTITISPALPELIGDASGTIDYAARYPGFTMSSASSFTIDHRGDIVTSTGTYSSSSPSLSISIGGISQTIGL